jgi:hypothetical protein
MQCETSGIRCEVAETCSVLCYYVRVVTISYRRFGILYLFLSQDSRIILVSWNLRGLISIIVQQNATTYSLLYFCKLLYMFRMLIPPIIRSTCNCNYSIWHWSNCLYYLPLSWRSWNCVPSSTFHLLPSTFHHLPSTFYFLPSTLYLLPSAIV